MSQFYHRFIRYDSENKTEVVFVTYKDSIEPNLLGLILDKKVLTEFVQTQAKTSRNNIVNDFGLDTTFLDGFIEKSTDADGKSYLSWGGSLYSQNQSETKRGQIKRSFQTHDRCKYNLRTRGDSDRSD